MRFRVVQLTDAETLCTHVEKLTRDDTKVYTDEWHGYSNINRQHNTVFHAQHEWTRDDNGNEIREVHINSVEGMWTLVRNFLRLFRGVHKKFLAGYVAICEFHINLKCITATLIVALVASHVTLT